MCSLHLQSGNSLEFYKGDSSFLFHMLSYSINSIYQYELICILFSTLGNNLILCIAPYSSFGHQLFPVSLTHSIRKRDSVCSRFIVYISCPNSRISHFSKEPDSFCWKIILETKVWNHVFSLPWGILFYLFKIQNDIGMVASGFCIGQVNSSLYS